MATIENVGTSPEALAKWRTSMQGMDRAEMLAQQLVQRGAEHALAELQKLGPTPENCAAMLSSIREGLFEIHSVAATRGIVLMGYAAPSSADEEIKPTQGTAHTIARLRALAEAERSAFEADIRKDAGDLSMFGSGNNRHYRNSAVNNAWGGWKARAALAARPPATGAQPVAVADRVVRMVGEMDDRTSPEDWPEAMLVTGNELHALIVQAFEQEAEAALHVGAKGGQQS